MNQPEAIASAPIPVRRNFDVTFEFFPPKTEKSTQELWQCIEKLSRVQPQFVSVTYGAGGSTRDRTHSTVEKILTQTDLTPAAHLTCVDASKNEIDSIAQGYRDIGVRHLVALRGDPGNGDVYSPHRDGYKSSLDMIDGLMKVSDFDISVPAYPEAHPDSRSPQADIDYLKAKVESGACRAITQFFFDNNHFYRFVERARAAGIFVPIVPGILPITNFAKTDAFAKRCGTEIPAWIGELFEGLDDDPATRELVAAAIAVEQCADLMENGIRHFHFYTLNRANLSHAICRTLRIRPASSSPHVREAAELLQETA